MSKKLLIVNAENYMEVPFENQLTIGRDVYNSLSLPDPEISRSHAIIFEQGDQTIIKDLNSRNGVYVNGDRVKEQVLQTGDEIVIGSSIIFFDPVREMDLDQGLSRRGGYVLSQAAERHRVKHVEPVTVYTCPQMNKIVQQVFNQPEDTTFFTMSNALGLLRAFYAMGRGRDTAELFQVTLEIALELLGGDHGVIMETDVTKDRIKVRSLISRKRNSDTIEISQQILRVVLRAERCVFCPDVNEDNRFNEVNSGGECPVHSFVAAPVMCGQNYYGFMYLYSETDATEYDYVSLRSLYFLASHLGALLQPHQTHFGHESALELHRGAAVGD